MTTDEHLARRKPSRLPLGLLGMLALIAGVEIYIAGRDVDLGTMYTLEWHAVARAVAKQAARPEILCFGTSLSKIAISPPILEERTGHSAYNFSISGSQPCAIYLMLRHALEAGAHPKAILVDFKWTSISNDPRNIERVFPEIASLGECVRMALAIPEGRGSFLGRLAMVKELPSFACREQIRDNITAAIKGTEPVRNEQWFTGSRNMRVNKGAHHTPKVPYKGEVNLEDVRFFPAEWACDPVNEVYIHKFLDLADSRKIPVFVVIPPVSPVAQARLDELGASARYTHFLEGVLAKHPGVTTLDGRWSGYPVEAFFDSSHVNRYGTADFSNALSNVLKARLDGPATSGHWVSMPKYAGGHGQEKIEDFMDSYAHIEAAQKAKIEEARRLAAGAKSEVRR